MNIPVRFRINQFSNVDKSLFENAIVDCQATPLKETISICHKCHYHIPAHTYIKNNQLWLVKNCKTHGISHHMIERDYNFYSKLEYEVKKDTEQDFQIITEVTDRCNIDCPHCYHIPDNKIIDIPIDQLIKKYESWNLDMEKVIFVLAGAEPTVRKDLLQLVTAIKNKWNTSKVVVLTNGIRYSDTRLVQNSIDAKLDAVCIGLNHPSYIDNPKIRQKQVNGINNCFKMGLTVETISYTMSSVSELHDILEEVMTSNWPARFFRIRYGSDIGRYPDQERLYLSDTYKLVKQWCKDHGRDFKDLPGDNNLYHTMISIDGIVIRLIQWCDETDINMDELDCGPYADFSSDGITNFLHSVIRRDVEKNQHTMLPDAVPAKYKFKQFSR